MSGSVARRRRPSEVVRKLILDAAAATFLERGYARATTREIAERAGTTEVLLFRQFQSKAQLFHVAVFEPFAAFIREYAADRARIAAQGASLRQQARNFVSGLYDVIERNRGLMMVLITTELYEDDVTAGLRGLDSLRTYFQVAVDEIQRGNPGATFDVALGARLSFGLVASAVLFESWLLEDDANSREERIEAITGFISGGIRMCRPKPDPASRAKLVSLPLPTEAKRLQRPKRKLRRRTPLRSRN